MKFKAVPFTAFITRQDTAETVATQVQKIIDQHTALGWEYMRMENVETHIAPSKGCFGLGAEPGFTSAYQILIFKK